MDPTRFDLLTRSLSRLPDGRPSRRGLLQAIAASLLASGLAPLAEIVAKGKRRRRKRKGRKGRRPCLTGQKRCKGRCAGCCNDADCGGNPCHIGVCADCPNGQRLCRGGCIPEDACCNDGECTGGRICVDGACACAADERLCEGTCIPVDACCGADCPSETCSPENCNGCCDGTTCRSGDSNNFCGRNGVACQQCAAGQTCDAGQCQTSSSACSPETCNGCCDGDTCREGVTINNCGRGGVACAQCGQGASCDGEQCRCPEGFSMCADGACVDDAQAHIHCCSQNDCFSCFTCSANHRCEATCPDGCCRPETALGICEPGTTNEFCGKNNGDCISCAATGRTCNFGVCE